MSDINDLAQRLKGCTHANVKQIGEEFFTREFLKYMADSLIGGARMVRNMPVAYEPSEFEKCVIHYCVRKLISDLWEFGLPTIKQFVREDGRFDLEKALFDGTYGSLNNGITHNLDVGKAWIYGTTAGIYDAWIGNLAERDRINAKDDVIPLMYTVYRLHSVLINGDWDAPSIMDLTFTSASRECFDWLRDYPDFSRQEMEKIAESTLDLGIKQASQLSIKSASKEQVLRDATAQGKLAYIFDPASQKIIFNPALEGAVQCFENAIRDVYFDKTRLQLDCPAKFVPSDLYPRGGMLHDLLCFRNSVYVEIYLQTHNRR